MSALRYCPHCGYWLLRGTIVEESHGARCPKAPKPKRQSRGPSFRQRCREALRAGLAAPGRWRLRLAALELGISGDQLRRVAEGKTDFAPSTWRRLAPYLGLSSPSQGEGK